MELPLFDQVDDLVRAMTPEHLGELKTRSHRRGIKVWFGQEKAGKQHYEAQILARRHVDGQEGVAIEIGFHSEHADPSKNQAVLDHLTTSERQWRKLLGAEAQGGVFFGAENWRRVSEAWIEPNLEDGELSFEIAARLVDYLSALEPRLP